MDIPRLDRPQFEPFDLGAFSADYAGKTVNLLVNPTRGFKQAFVSASWDASFGNNADVMAAFVEAVIGAPPGKLDETIGDVPDEVVQWLFLYTFDDFDGEKFGTTIRPHLLVFWDEAKTRRVKAHAAPGSLYKRPESAAQSQK